MKERPILFQGAMVRALLAGTKLQTRRVCKLEVRAGMPEPEWQSLLKLCPYGQPGDRLWVRETFYCDDAFYPNGVGVNSMWREVDGKREPIPVDEQRKDMLERSMYYRADGEPEFEAPEGPTPWRPSIHMPRWASRITLEITGVRVERLQAISEADAAAEGVFTWREGWDQKAAATAFLHGTQARVKTNDGGIAQRLYHLLWEQINGAGSWEVNPWVWVVEFNRVKP